MSFDKDKFATYLRKNAHPHSQRRCARAVRQALEAAGARTRGHPVDARDYGTILQSNGFSVVSFTTLKNYVPIKGDVVVFDPHPGGNPSGHIQAYDEREEAVYVVYRR